MSNKQKHYGRLIGFYLLLRESIQTAPVATNRSKITTKVRPAVVPTAVRVFRE